jgi:hypothetical protein
VKHGPLLELVNNNTSKEWPRATACAPLVTVRSAAAHSGADPAAPEAAAFAAGTLVAGFGGAVADVVAEGGDVPVAPTPQADTTTVTAAIARIVVRIWPRLTKAVLVARVLFR